LIISIAYVAPSTWSLGMLHVKVPVFLMWSAMTVPVLKSPLGPERSVRVTVLPARFVQVKVWDPPALRPI